PWNAKWPPLMLVLLPFQFSLSQGPDGGPAHHRAVRMTPFWRMVGSKPLGAYCWHGLECSTKMCAPQSRPTVPFYSSPEYPPPLSSASAL
uniref:Liver-expressed antimicrobial peptide 2 n=1 Tax=Chelydra serpentina TaxID=8475 RepID=A0A8C3XUC7_CHESE